MVIKGSIDLPGDKSISHRALMLSSLSSRISTISNLSSGKDVQSTKECLALCGVKFGNSKETTTVKGGLFNDPSSSLNCGNSGTTVRLLLGLLSGQKINATFVGDESLSIRPMKRIIKPLAQMGLSIKSNDNKLPIAIESSKLIGINYSTLIASAQIKSAVLLAGIGANKETTFTEPYLSRDHTEIMLKNIGANISVEKLSTSIKKTTKFLPINIVVPGDPSSASFFAAAATLIPNSVITLNHISLNPTRLGFFKFLKKMGGKIEFINERDVSGEKIGDIKISYSRLKAINISEEDIPALVDELPILSILATQANGVSRITGAEELRVKESDRINSICQNLSKMGANIKELHDGFIIKGPSKLKGSYIKTYNDHRIAMAFSIADLIAKDNILLDNPTCVSISFPEFYNILKQLKK